MLRKKTMSSANLALEAGTAPPPPPSRRRSFMHFTSSSSGLRDPSPGPRPVTRENTGFRSRLYRINSSFGGMSPGLASPTVGNLGLSLIHTPEGPDSPVGDIVFVHGLGGSAYETWSWNRDVENFWPPWLAEDEVLTRYRIFTFGYNSNFKGEATSLEVIDFAKDLLLQMLTFSGGVGANRPVLFIAHSMGGLVVKKAILLGLNDRLFKSMVDNVYGVIFLATPHRGTQYARTLNNILSATSIGGGTRPYVAELDKQSSIIQDVNENFRQVCHRLTLASFYETTKTSFAVTKLLLVEKESAVLGYSNEVSASMDADHHSICKFKSQFDPNYLKVKGLMRKWADDILETNASTVGTEDITSANSQVKLADSISIDSTVRDTDWASPDRLSADWRKTVRSILGIFEPSEPELGAIRANLSPNSGSWLHHRSDYISWLHNAFDDLDPTPAFFWLLGLPGNGKTSLASCVVTDLQERGNFLVQHHFFSERHQRKKTVAYCLKSLAAQLALADETFRTALVALNEESGVDFSNQTQPFHVIWDKIFEKIIFQMQFSRPLVWVLDGVDEADAPHALLTAISRIHAVSRLRIFLTSRPLKGVSLLKDLRLTSYFLQQSDTAQDIRDYTVAAVRNALPDEDGRQRRMVNDILRQAEGNFLWVKLALDALQDAWHTEEDIRMILTEAPHGMMSMYRRMLESIEAQGQRNQTIARRILTWAVCSWRPLSITELEVALSSEFRGFMNLEQSITQLCGNFITINRSNPLKPRVNLIHNTAREFLVKGDGPDVEPFIDAQTGHQHLATICLMYLSTERWAPTFSSFLDEPGRRGILADNEIAGRINFLVKIAQDHAFLQYAVSYWAYHVAKSPVHSTTLMQALKLFFTRFCLSWIEAIALSGNLHGLTSAAQYLKSYVKKCERHHKRADIDEADDDGADAESPNAVRFQTSHLTRSFRRIAEVDDEPLRMIRDWANDFIRLGAKFGLSLLRDPSSVHRRIPPFCPRKSITWKTYGAPPPAPSTLLANTGRRPSQQSLCVTGLPSESWDDCLASVSVGSSDEHVTQLLASETHILGLVSSTGAVSVWNAHTCELVQTLHQNEYVRFMVLNQSGTLVATAGFQSFCVWEVGAGRRVSMISKSTNAIVLEIAFANSDTELVIGLDNGSLLWLDMVTGRERKHWVARVPSGGDYAYGCPDKMVLSSDLKRLAMAWSGRPPMVWDLTAPPSSPPVQCPTSGPSEPINAPGLLVWNPDTGSLLVLCQNTLLIEWKVSQATAGQIAGQIADVDNKGGSVTKEFTQIQAWCMSISRDGKYLLTNDTSKTISLWSFPSLHLVYRLVSVGDPVSDLTFAPGCQRFYDARGAMCNVWEPDVLLLTGGEDAESLSLSEDGSGLTASMSGSFVLNEPVIGQNHLGAGCGRGTKCVVTALCVDSTGHYYCCGREDGSVQIHDAVEGHRLRKVYNHAGSLAVLALSWSPSGRYVVSCDESARVMAKRLSHKEDGRWAVFPVFDSGLTEPVTQFVWGPGETHLLISTAGTDQVWDLKAKVLVQVRRWGAGRPRRWIMDPREKRILWVEPDGMRAYRWPSLEEEPGEVSHVRLTEQWHGAGHSRRGHSHSRSTSSSTNAITNGSINSDAISPLPLGLVPSPTWSRRSSYAGEPVPVRVTWAGASGDGRSLVVATVPDDGRMWLSGLKLTVMDLDEASEGGGGAMVRRQRRLKGLETRVKLLIGMYKNKLLFLDRDSWVCSWDVSAGKGARRGSSGPRELEEATVVEEVSVARHFFIPKDWLVTHTAPTPKVNSQGTFFYPRHGDVAVIWSGVNV